jgi:hypothetical protein
VLSLTAVSVCVRVCARTRVRVRAYARARACVRVCVRSCVRVCVCVRAHVMRVQKGFYHKLMTMTDDYLAKIGATPPLPFYLPLPLSLPLPLPLPLPSLCQTDDNLRE